MFDKCFYMGNNVIINGLTFELNIIYLLEKFKIEKKTILVVTNSLYEANKFYNNLLSYTSETLLFPMDDFLTTVAIAASPDLKLKRLETLERIKENRNYIVVTNLMGYLKFVPQKEFNNFPVLKKGKICKRNEIINILENMGYTKVSLVTSTGEYALRGYIIDIFIANSENPLRIELFGDEIESLRYFNADNQRSIKDTESAELLPFEEMIDDKHTSLFKYIGNPLIVFYNYQQIEIGYKKLQNEISEYNLSIDKNDKYMYEFEEIDFEKFIYLNSLDFYKKDVVSYNYSASEIDNFNGNLTLLKSFVNKNLKNKMTIIICLSTDIQIEKIKNLFPNYVLIKKLNEIIPGMTNIIHKFLNKGFKIEKNIYISSNDIDKSSEDKVNYQNKFKLGKKISNFNEIKRGDYVVHESHGIGIYYGVVTLNSHGMLKDYIRLDYQGTDKMYIPVEKIDTIYKYASAEDTKPKIHHLNSLTWKKTKLMLQKKVKDISKELIALYAQRKNIEGPKYKEYEEELIFANDFGYQLTEDQNKAISSVLSDLSSPIPMDRLLCGDVGFGKTEVAFRAMFKTVLNGYQVLYLCPTTILSKQQYLSAIDRFEQYGVKVALLNRYTNKNEQNEILNDLRSGKIDILFGTHRILSDDVVCKKLGLLVIDEEQRFGVAHKERIKKIKKDVNVLTLSATPIPRTLKLSLTGIRDLSIIETPPVNRYPIQTYVMAENILIIQDAIYKELSRNGQAFILYNNIDDLENKVNTLSSHIPDAKITFAHGRMKKEELEKIMSDFIAHKYDILVCTTIIETGIDIPNSNTLIILNAQNFGLSQLYQIRGRVGRSNRIAYAYFMYNPHRILNENAIKRLESIKEYTQLGSGYKIAYRDLSIRGAGNILGSEQAGYINNVGIDLFMKFLDDEIKRLNGQVVEQDEGNALINVDTHIEDFYVFDEDIKIEIHQLINKIHSRETLDVVKAEIEDRFGKIDEKTEIYMYEEWFEKIANDLNIKNVVQNKNKILLELPYEISHKMNMDNFDEYLYEQQIEIKQKKDRICIEVKKINKQNLQNLIELLEYIKKSQDTNV